MLVIMWLLVGAAALCLESGLLTLNVLPGSEPLVAGQYVSPFGALQFDLGVKKKLPTTWPWAQESLAGAIEQAGKHREGRRGLHSEVRGSSVEGLLNPVAGLAEGHI